MSKPSLEELQDFINRSLPQTKSCIEILSLGRLANVKQEEQSCRLRLLCDPHFLRPGETVSGPAMMLLADCAAYVAILANIGLTPMAVTTNISIDFLRMPGKRDLLAVARINKMGKKLAQIGVCIFPMPEAGLGMDENRSKMVAMAMCSYSLPPIRGKNR